MKEESIKIDYKKIKKTSLNLLEKINAFFSHRENIAFLIFIFSLAFLTRFIDIPHSLGIKLTSIWLLLFLGHFIIFELEKTEQFLLNKITWILLIAIIIIIKYQIFFGIENKDVFFMIGAIFAFWYGYKKYERDKKDEIEREKNRDSQYERDKELELIEKYTKKYDEVKNNNIELLSLWEKEYFLHKKGYISNELWLEWDFWIRYDIFYSMMNHLNGKSTIIDDFVNNYLLYHYHFLNSGKNNSYTDYILDILKILREKNPEVFQEGSNILKYLNKNINDIENRE